MSGAARTDAPIPLWARWLGQPRRSDNDIDMFAHQRSRMGHSEHAGHQRRPQDAVRRRLARRRRAGHSLQAACARPRERRGAQAGRGDHGVIHRRIAAVQDAGFVQSMQAETAGCAAAERRRALYRSWAATEAAACCSRSMPPRSRRRPSGASRRTARMAVSGNRARVPRPTPTATSILMTAQRHVRRRHQRQELWRQLRQAAAGRAESGRQGLLSPRAIRSSSRQRSRSRLWRPGADRRNAAMARRRRQGGRAVCRVRDKHGQIRQDTRPTGACTNPNVAQQVMAFPPVIHDGTTHYGNIHGSPVFWKGPGRRVHLRLGREQSTEGVSVQGRTSAGRTEAEYVPAAPRHARRHVVADRQRQRSGQRHSMGGRPARWRRQQATRRARDRPGARRGGCQSDAVDERTGRPAGIVLACSRSSRRPRWSAASCSSRPMATTSRCASTAATTVRRSFPIITSPSMARRPRRRHGRSSTRTARTSRWCAPRQGR